MWNVGCCDLNSFKNRSIFRWLHSLSFLLLPHSHSLSLFSSQLPSSALPPSRVYGTYYAIVQVLCSQSCVCWSNCCSAIIVEFYYNGSSAFSFHFPSSSSGLRFLLWLRCTSVYTMCHTVCCGCGCLLPGGGSLFGWAKLPSLRAKLSLVADSELIFRCSPLRALALPPACASWAEDSSGLVAGGPRRIT